MDQSHNSRDRRSITAQRGMVAIVADCRVFGRHRRTLVSNPGCGRCVGAPDRAGVPKRSGPQKGPYRSYAGGLSLDGRRVRVSKGEIGVYRRHQPESTALYAAPRPREFTGTAPSFRLRSR